MAHTPKGRRTGSQDCLHRPVLVWNVFHYPNRVGEHITRKNLIPSDSHNPHVKSVLFVAFVVHSLLTYHTSGRNRRTIKSFLSKKNLKTEMEDLEVSQGSLLQAFL